MREVLSGIEAESGLSFAYNPKKIAVDELLSFSAFGTVGLVLQQLSLLTSLRFSLIENQIIIKKPKKSRSKELAPATLSGYIKDASSGEALIGSTVYLPKLEKGVAANAFGFYSITVPPGEYEVQYRFIGYEDQIIRLDISTSITHGISMVEEPPVLEEVIVTGYAAQDVDEVQLSTSRIRPKTVSEMPALFGEMDVIKVMESVPGFKLHSDGSTFYYVRGGYKDQNLILMDDAPIFNPSHMLGIFSTVIPDAVNDITLFKGDMPAFYGGRLSSVLDIRTKKGNEDHFQFWGNVGVISTKLGVEGPIKKSKSSYLLSGRFSRIGWFFKQLDDNLEKLNFFDLTGKLNFNLNPKNRLFFSFYSGRDNFFQTGNGISWSNGTATLRWNHIFDNRLFLNTTILASDYDYELHVDRANNVRWNSGIANFALKTDFTSFIKPQETFDFGMHLTALNFNPGNIEAPPSINFFPVTSVRNSVEFALYGNHELRLGKKTGLRYGLRLVSWVNQGDAFEFTFDGNGNPIDTTFYVEGEEYIDFASAEPRLTLTHDFNENTTGKLSFTRNVQNVHLISNSISPFTSLEVWLPSSVNIKPQSANQVNAGVHRKSPEKGTSWEIEAFFKRMNSQIDYEPHAETLLNPLLESELRFGEAWAYGIEGTIKKSQGRLRGWAGYSYSRAKRKFPDLNGGRVYNAFYDRPHEINLVTNYDVNLRCTIGLNWNYYTGAPFSSPTSFFYFNGLEAPIYTQKNNDRLPDYHRLDFTATLKLNKNPEQNFNHSLTFSLYNVYGRKNALFINYNKTQTEGDGLKIPSNVFDPNRTTTQFHLFRFTPSFTYNFTFK